MTEVNENMERRIVRFLDGVLSEEEQLELQRELLRDPHARALMEEYRRIDELSAAAMNHAFADEDVSFDPQHLAQREEPRRRGYYRAWWLIPGAIAAALLAVVLPRPDWRSVESSNSIASQRAPASLPVIDSKQNQVGEVMHHAGWGLQPQVQRDSGSELIGVMGDDGKMYWIEVDRTRTLKKAPPQIARQWATGGI
jgi:hypothetical protein